jgi:hypothetical protein
MKLQRAIFWAGLLCLVWSEPSAQAAAAAVDTARAQERGLRYELLYGLLLEQSNEENTALKTGVSLQYSLLYYWNRKIGLGLGNGLQFYNFDRGGVFVPLSLEAAGSWLPGWSWQPRYSLSAGYGVLLGDADVSKSRGGFCGRASLGLAKNFQEQEMGLLVDLGYQIQRSTLIEDRFWGVRQIQRWTFQRISLRLGIFF